MGDLLFKKAKISENNNKIFQDWLSGTIIAIFMLKFDRFDLKPTKATVTVNTTENQESGVISLVSSDEEL